MFIDAVFLNNSSIPSTHLVIRDVSFSLWRGELQPLSYSVFTGSIHLDFVSFIEFC